MWKRDVSVKPAGPAVMPGAPTRQTALGSARSELTDMRRQHEKGAVNIGKSVVVKGELSGSEDLTIDGVVEGKIELKEHVLTVGPNGKIKAKISAKVVIVLGEVVGDVTATQKLDIRENGSVDGDIVSPRIAMAEGAHFRGSVDMKRRSSTVGSNLEQSQMSHSMLGSGLRNQTGNR